MFIVRFRTSSDLDELVGLAARVRVVDEYPLYLPDNDFRRFLTEPSPLAAWVAEEGGRIVGHVAANSQSHKAVMAVVLEASITGDIGVVARLLVDVDVRRQGIGEALLDEATKHILSLGRTPVLDVVDTARPAISLYRRTGWKDIGRVSFDVQGRVITELVFAVQA